MKTTINERPAEYAFAFHHLQELCVGKILDVGSGKTSWPHLLSVCGYSVKAIDKKSSNKYYKVIKDDITKTRLKEQFQIITCLSVLEHIPDHQAAVKNMFRLLIPGGYLILSFPYNEDQYYENIYDHPEAGYGKNYKFITQIYSRKEIDKWLKESPWSIRTQEYYETFTGKLWTFGERLNPTVKVS